jgi:hypothetical protein
MGKFKASWAIFLRTLQVMQQHKVLLVFPLMIASLTVVIAGFFLAPIVLQPTGYRYTEGAHWKAVGASVFTEESMKSLETTDPKQRPQARDMEFNDRILGYLTVLYFVSMFLASFFNVAFCSQIMLALRGGEVSIGAGLQFALSRWQPILFWSLLTGLVGYLIQKLEGSFGFIGRFVIGLIGLVWSVASVFAIPVLVEESDIRNPVDVVRKSAGIIKKTWGESLIGYLGLQLSGFLSILVLLACGAVAILLAIYTQAWWLPFAALGIWLVFTIVFSYLTSVASQIYQCALYIYASTGSVPTPFDRSMMDNAWKTK